jgi:hypothetical protein
MRPSLPGSGKFVTPWVCMHWEKLSPCARICCISAGVGALPFGSRCWQELWAEGNRGLLRAICFVLGGKLPLLLGSGQFGTPCERMQRAKASA